MAGRNKPGYWTGNLRGAFNLPVAAGSQSLIRRAFAHGRKRRYARRHGLRFDRQLR